MPFMNLALARSLYMHLTIKDGHLIESLMIITKRRARKTIT